MKFFVYLFLIFSVSLFANNDLTEYRINGIKSLQKKFDYELTKLDYWKEYLKDKDTSFGYIESSSSILICNTNASKIKLYKKDNNNKFKLNTEYNAFTGKLKGDKQEEGDLRTPLGIYHLTKKIVKLDSFYGPLAFVTSYPNVYDKYKNKNGSGIWIHGLPEDEERDSFTKGCIAIDNDDIKKLDKTINFEKTLLIIDEEKIENLTSKKKLSNILAQIYMWRYAWINNDLDKYISFYSNEFKRVDGVGIDNFKRYKKRLFSKNEYKTIVFKNIDVVPYPNSKNIYKVSFKELYKSDSFSFIGEKVLMLKIDKKNTISIITEK